MSESPREPQTEPTPEETHDHEWVAPDALEILEVVGDTISLDGAEHHLGAEVAESDADDATE